MKPQYLFAILAIAISNLADAYEIKYFIVNKTNAVGCINKNDPDTCHGLSLGKYLIPTIEQKKNKNWAKDKWIYIENDIMADKPYWIETKYIVADNTFKKVESDWKVKSLRFDDADLRITITFTRDGKATFNGMPAHVYIDPSEIPYFVQIRHHHPKYGEISDTYRYHPSKRIFDTKHICMPSELCEQITYD